MYYWGWTDQSNSVRESTHKHAHTHCTYLTEYHNVSAILQVCFYSRNANKWSKQVFLFSFALYSWLRLLCPDYPRTEQTQHHGGDSVLDGSRGCDQEGLWTQSGHLVSWDHGHRDGGGRASISQREPSQGEFVLKQRPLLLISKFFVLFFLVNLFVWGNCEIFFHLYFLVISSNCLFCQCTSQRCFYFLIVK